MSRRTHLIMPLLPKHNAMNDPMTNARISYATSLIEIFEKTVATGDPNMAIADRVERLMREWGWLPKEAPL